MSCTGKRATGTLCNRRTFSSKNPAWRASSWETLHPGLQHVQQPSRVATVMPACSSLGPPPLTVAYRGCPDSWPGESSHLKARAAQTAIVPCPPATGSYPSARGSYSSPRRSPRASGYTSSAPSRKCDTCRPAGPANACHGHPQHAAAGSGGPRAQQQDTRNGPQEIGQLFVPVCACVPRRFALRCSVRHPSTDGRSAFPQQSATFPYRPSRNHGGRPAGITFHHSHGL
jgi:hypothetical protein